MKSESGFPPDAAFSVRKSGVRLVLSERFLQSARESSRPNATPRRTRASLGCLRDLVFGAAERREGGEGGREVLRPLRRHGPGRGKGATRKRRDGTARGKKVVLLSMNDGDDDMTGNLCSAS